jgi:hypothetical protein
MSLRSWLIRGSILTGVAAVAALVWVANSWVSPERVKAQVIATLSEQFEGVEIHVGSARMRILGGIALTDVRLTRRGSEGEAPFLSVPSGIVYHDKEQLNRGRLVIKKIELEKPELNLERAPDGKWNVAEVMKQGPADKPIPTFVIQGGVIHIKDRGPEPLPEIELTGVNLTLLNDPLPILAIQARAASKGFGSITARARLNRVTGGILLGLDLPDFPLGEVVAANADRFSPGFGHHLAGLKAKAAITADLTYLPEAARKWRHEVQVTLKDASFTHPELPWPVETIVAKVHVVDGRIRVDDATAQVAGSRLKLSLETRAEENTKKPAAEAIPEDMLGHVEEHFQRVELAWTGVTFEEALFRNLPAKLKQLRQQFSPVGQADLGYKFTRDASGWKREFELRPRQIEATYEKFKYPMTIRGGWLKRLVTPNAEPVTSIDLTGTAAEQTITIKGQITGDGDDPGINLRLTGTNIPLDEKLVAAFPPRFAEMVKQLRATGRGDFVGEFVQAPGSNHLENEFRIDIRAATLNRVLFKYSEGVLAALRSASVPEAVLEKLTPLRNRELSHDDFVREVNRFLSAEEAQRFQELITSHARNLAEIPYTLENVKGRLVVRITTSDPSRPAGRREEGQADNAPDRDEIVLDGFTAMHAGAMIRLNGSRRPLPGSRDRKLILHLSGESCPIDADMRSTFGAMKLDSLWSTYDPRGNLTFVANVELMARAPTPDRPEFEPPIDPATDLKLTLQFSGPTITPAFFRYEMKELSGSLEYKNSRLDLRHVAARHGDTRIKLDAGEIRFYTDGVVWANLGGLEAKPLNMDADFLKALPPKLGSGMEELRIKGNTELFIKHLVVLTPSDGSAPGVVAAGSALPEPASRSLYLGQPLAITPISHRVELVDPVRSLRALSANKPGKPSTEAAPGNTSQRDPLVYWDAEIKLGGASFDTGVAWEQVYGAVACRGRFEGTHLGQVRGAIWFDRAVIARQPVTRLAGRVRAGSQQPDPAYPGQYLPSELQFTDLTGELFHGALGGESRVVLTSPARFSLWVTATDVQLDEIAKHYKLGSDADLKGIAQAQLWLYNRPDPRTGKLALEGSGKVSVPTGRMYNLPVLLDLVKVVKFGTPDKTAFEEANAVFRIQGDRVKVEQMDLIGRAICLGGSGELDTSGDYVKFEFYTVTSQVLARMINTPVGDLTAFLSKNLFKIKLTRENGELKYKSEPFPLVTEPARLVADRLRARTSQMFGGGKKEPVAPDK